MRMPQSEKISIEEFLNRFTLIIGEINSGKTTMTSNILATFCRTIGGQIAVIDLAPEITPQDLASQTNQNPVGGRLQIPESKSVRYYHKRIYPPRLRAGDEKEAKVLAKENLHTIDQLLEKALMKETDALFVNDCSLYLHAGRPDRLLGWIRSSPTAVVNGYYGKSFKKSRISMREKRGMDFLMRHCDRLISKIVPACGFEH